MSYQIKLWDSKREKINRPEHSAGHSQNKGTEQVQRRAHRLQTGPAPPEAGEGKGAGSAPEDRIPHRAANGPPVSNQRPPGIQDGGHPPGGSRGDTGRTHPTGAGGDWGRGRRGGGARTGESAPVKPLAA